MGVQVDPEDSDLFQNQITLAAQNFRGFSVYAYSSIFDSPNTQTDSQDRTALIERQERRKVLVPMLQEFGQSRIAKMGD